MFNSKMMKRTTLQRKNMKISKNSTRKIQFCLTVNATALK